jgi:hypothetical protein
VALLGSWAQIIEIELGIVGSGASFTASISANVMTVTAVSAGTLAVGQMVVSSFVAVETIITALGTGTGGTGTYLVSANQVVASAAMTSTVLGDQVAVTIGQVPSVAAGDIYL